MDAVFIQTLEGSMVAYYLRFSSVKQLAELRKAEASGINKSACTKFFPDRSKAVEDFFCVR
jgi:hypothetical protein